MPGKSKTTLMPKAVDESDRFFKRRCETYQMFTIHPFDPKREDEDKYDRRLRAHKEVPQVPYEPGDEEMLRKFPSEAAKLEKEKLEAAKLMAKMQEEEAKAKAKEEAANEAEARKRAQSEEERTERAAINAEKDAAMMALPPVEVGETAHAARAPQ